MRSREKLKWFIATEKRHWWGSRSEERFPDATPMGDLSFLLFIFFIVTGSFILREGIYLSLPSKNAAPVHVSEDRVIEVWPRDEGFLFGGAMLTRIAFLNEMKSQAAKGSGKTLIVWMRDDVGYERMVDTLSVAREAGIGKVSLQNYGEEPAR